MAPELPAETTAWASPFLTSSKATRIEASRFLRTACPGWSSMGMTSLQILWMIELPMALAIIMAGVRTATVLIVGVATLAALIGGGGLGELIFRGIAMANSPLILAGALPAAALAVFFDYALKHLEYRTQPGALAKK